MNKMIYACMLSLCFSIAGISAHDKKDNCYLQELKNLKKSSEHELIFNEDANPGLVHIQKRLEICKELSSLQRLARFMFLALDPVIVTQKTMPQLYGYVEGVCKKAGIAIPKIFITSDKHGFFNAAAAKLFISTGGIIIGQKMIYETSQAELEAVLAHEIGHIKHNHANKTLALMLASYVGTSVLTNIAVEGYRAITNTSDTLYTPAEMNAKMWLPILALLYGPCFIINKRFEKEADLFACDNEGAEGLIAFFEDIKKREEQEDIDFDSTYEKLQAGKSKIAFGDYLGLFFSYYLHKGGHYVDKAFRYVYHHTPLGDHPSHDARIKAAQDYIAHHSDWDAA